MIGTARLPELGPWLGRLCAAPAPVPREAVPLDDIRLALASQTLDLAGAARDFADGDRAAAVSALRARDWRMAWDAAVRSAAERTASAIDARFSAAANESRFPSRRLARLKVSAPEQEAIAARLGAGGLAFESALQQLDELAGPAARGGSEGAAAFAAWWEAVTDAARRLDSGWVALSERAQEEVERWMPEVEKVRRWTRPRWLLWVLSLATVALATWLGLMLGGYVPVPGPLRPLAEWWWKAVTFA